MGLLLIAPTSFQEFQGIVIYLKRSYTKVVGLYIRETPNDKEIYAMYETFEDFDCIIDDLNLNPAIAEQKSKLQKEIGRGKSVKLLQ